MIDLLHGDCLIESDKIESGSVDLILTDLPYGNMKNAPSTWDKSKTEWDTTIDPKKVYDIANRILRKNGKMILFSQEPYTTKLITEATTNISFGYRATWEKDNFANALCCNKNMVSFTEDVLIFSKMHDFEGLHPLRPYFKKVLDFLDVKKVRIIEKIGQGVDHCFRVNSSQFHLPTKETYNKLIEYYNINEMVDFRTFEDISKERMNSTFNLWQGNKYKSNILKYKKDYNGHHPTQKPILLLEDLIKTFSNENDLVVDLTMGSGSTGVACVNTNRSFTGIEMDDSYFDIAEERINNIKIKINGINNTLK